MNFCTQQIVTRQAKLVWAREDTRHQNISVKMTKWIYRERQKGCVTKKQCQLTSDIAQKTDSHILEQEAEVEKMTSKDDL